MYMPAPFVAELGGLRSIGGNPNTSDNNDDQSIELGLQLMEEMGIPVGTVGPIDPGSRMVTRTIEHLRELRPDLLIDAGSALRFAQYAHLAVYPEFKRAWKNPADILKALDKEVSSLGPGLTSARMAAALKQARTRLDSQAQAVERLTEQMPEESILNLDITVAEEGSSRQTSVASGRPFWKVVTPDRPSAGLRLTGLEISESATRPDAPFCGPHN